MSTSSRPVEVFMFIDALGWDIVNRTGFLKDILPERRSARMQFGYSCSAIPTILTGVPPASHGHLSAFRFDPEHSPFTRISWLGKLFHPSFFWNHSRIRYRLSKFVKFCCGFTGYFQLYQMSFARLRYMDYIEKTDMFMPHGMGDIANLRDVLDSSGIKFHMADWHWDDEKNILMAREAISSGAEFVFIYTASLDGVLHQYVNDPDVVQQKLDWFDKHIRTLFTTGRDIHLTIFSDHGMTPLTYTVDVRSEVEKTGLRFGIDYGACYDSTMARFTYLSKDAKARIHQAMEPLAKHGRWLTADEEKEYGIYRDDRFFGDEIFFMNVGIQIVPSDMGAKALNGMHGFEPTDILSQAAILSDSPIPEDIQSVTDYFSLMTRRIDEIKEQHGK